MFFGTHLSRKTVLAAWSAMLCFILFQVASTVGANSELPSLGEHASINIERESELGRSVYEKLLDGGWIETDPLLDRYINDLGFRLLSAVEQRVREYKFFIIRDDSVNAFALPGGYIGVNQGLIRRARTQHQLASVMAHEIAHVRLRHGIDMLEKGSELSSTVMLAVLAGLLLGSVDSQVGSAIAFGGVAGSQQALVNFTRENEYEADRLGIELMHAAQFDAIGTVEFFQIISSLSGSSELGSIEYLRTHPVSSNRIAEASARIKDFKYSGQQVDDYLLFKDYLQYRSSDHLPDQGSPYLRALASRLAANYPRADAQLAELYRSDSENVWYGIAFAQNLEQLSRKTEAEQVYRKLLEIFPGDYSLSLGLLNLLKTNDQSESALTIARDLEVRFPESQQVYFELSKIYQALQKPALRMMAEAEFHRLAGNPQQAIKLYDQILKTSDVDLATESKAREKRLILLQN